MISVLVIALGLLSIALGVRPSATPSTCSAMTAAIPSGDHCSVSKDCTSLECSTTILKLPFKYNITIRKCHHPVQLFFSAAGSGLHWSHTFEGDQTVAISNVPSQFGKPFVHVIVKQVKGGVEVSATLLIKTNGIQVESIPIVNKEKIPLDTSDCPSVGPPDSYETYQPNTEGPDGIMWMDLLKRLANMGFINPFGHGEISPWDSGSSTDMPSALAVDMWQDPTFQACLQKLQLEGSLNNWEKTNELEKCYCEGEYDASALAYSTFCNKSGADNGDSKSKYFIIGGCIGGAILVAVIVAIILFTVYMKKKVPTTGGMSYKELEEE